MKQTKPSNSICDAKWHLRCPRNFRQLLGYYPFLRYLLQTYAHFQNCGSLGVTWMNLTLSFSSSSSGLMEGRQHSGSLPVNKVHNFEKDIFKTMTCKEVGSLVSICVQSSSVCESRGGRPGLPVPNSLCGRKATLNLCECAWEPVWRSGSKSRGIITLSYTDYLYNVNFIL